MKSSFTLWILLFFIFCGSLNAQKEVRISQGINKSLVKNIDSTGKNYYRLSKLKPTFNLAYSFNKIGKVKNTIHLSYIVRKYRTSKSSGGGGGGSSSSIEVDLSSVLLGISIGDYFFKSKRLFFEIGP